MKYFNKNILSCVKLIAFGFIIFAHSLVFVAYADSLSLEQLVKSTGATASNYRTQKLLCTDLSGQIDSVTYSFSNPNSSPIDVLALFYPSWVTPGVQFGDGAWVTLPANSPQQDYTFHLLQPIVVADLCSGGAGFINLWVSSNSSFVVYGSDNSNAYRDANFDSNSSEVKDLYFIVNGSTNINHAPTLDPIDDKMVDENNLLQFAITATDPDGDTLTYSSSNLPTGASLDPITGVFSWIPSFGQAGNYTDVEFTVTDNGNPIQLDAKLITITVSHVNRPPVFIAIGSQEVLEGNTLSFSVNAIDPDNDSIVFSVTSLPSGATFNADTGVFSWVPNISQAGSYVVNFMVVDNGTPTTSSVLGVAISVGDVPTPIEQADNIINVIISENFPISVENSYLSNLRKIPSFIESGKITPAINQINAFISKVQTDVVHGIITTAFGNELIALANALKSDLR